ncbi:MAG: site-specific integrase [Candidatus Omnitrophota bacterium]
MVDSKQKFATIPKSKYPGKKDAKDEAGRRELGGILTKDTAFKDFALQVLESKRPSDATREVFLETVHHFDIFLQKRSRQSMEDYSESLLNDYKNSKHDEGRSKSGINRDLDYLKEIGKSALNKRLVTKFDPKEIRSFPFEKKVWILPTQEERLKILKWFYKNKPYFYAWIYFVITRGWRRSEFRKMLISDVDLASKIVYIRNAKTEPRPAKLTDQDCMVFNEHIILLKKMKKYKPDGLLYPPFHKGTDFIGKDLLLNYVKRACKELDIKKNITNHIFRHWVVTNILDNTANVEVVKAITGHKDSATIFKYYAHATPENVARGLEITKIDTGLMPKVMPKKGKNGDL